ncbi:hypothetical protein M9Y10_031315 [Tritrichomonas musculus]|uniref:Uncharacterized protein n=1 Tax=Tritrichomonas musculus TaxID=1915356 RepID=A0ABR2H1J2_9EUKA
MTASLNDFPTIDEVNSAFEQLKETMIDKENLYTSDKIILDSEGFISFDTTLNDSNDETIMTSKSTSKLLKAINSYLNKKFVDFYDAIENHDIWISEAEDKYRLKNDLSYYDKRELEIISTQKYQIEYNDKYPNTNDSAKIAKIEYHENAKLIGKYIIDNVEYEFDIYFKSDDIIEDNHFMLLNTETNTMLIWSESTTELVLISLNEEILVDIIIESAYLEINDELALKSELPEPVDLSNYALKSDIPLVVQSDETECDATAAVPSLDYVVNTYQTIFESNLIDKKANLLEKQLTAIDNKFSNYALKSETDTKLTQLDNYYDSLVEQLDSTYYDKTDCDEKYISKSSICNDESKRKIDGMSLIQKKDGSEWYSCSISKDSQFIIYAKQYGFYLTINDGLYTSGHYIYQPSDSTETYAEFRFDGTSKNNDYAGIRLTYNGSLWNLSSQQPPSKISEFYVLNNDTTQIPNINYLENRIADYALKSENDELKAKINSLESRLAALEGSSFATKAELSQYRKLNDLVVSNQKVLPITNKEVLLDNGDEQWRFTTSHIPFHEGTHLIGKYTEPDGVEHEINVIFQGEEDFSEEFQNCFLILKQFQYSEGIFIEWDKMTGAIYIFDDVNYSYYMGCEITSAILDEGITLATNYNLTNYYSKDDLTRFGLIETDSYETDKFELSMDDKTHIRFKYLGSGINGVWNLIQIFVFQDISGHKHFIKWDFVHRIISLDTSFYTTYEIPKTQTNLEEINITIETRGFITTQELVNKFERFAYQQMSYQFANKLVSI